MKNGVIVILFILLNTPGFSQSTDEVEKLFIRVYDVNGDKIGKGDFSSLTDTVLYLSSNQKNIGIPITNINRIKVKRSFGHIPAVLGLLGFGVGAITGSDGGFGGAAILGEGLAFGGGGAILGAIISAPIKRDVYEINTDFKMLKNAIDTIEKGRKKE